MDKYILFAVFCLITIILPVNIYAQTEPEMKSIDTIEKLVDRSYIKNGLTFNVNGYHKTGDGGGGVFVYEPESLLEADGGTVIKLKNLPGRALRIYQPKADVYAEWFGAYGDGIHDDKDAINACLKKFKKVKLLAKTYGVRGTPSKNHPELTSCSIILESDYKIEGSGKDKTKVLLLGGTNPNSGVKGGEHFNIFHNGNYNRSAENVEIRDMTIDCNFDNQDKHATISAIHVRGGSALIEHLNLRRFGTGHDPLTGRTAEAFVVAQRLVYKDKTSSRKNATMRDLDFTEPGMNGDIEGHVAEITLIAIGGAHNFSNSNKDPDFDPTNGGENENNWWPAWGGLVENIYVHDMRFDPAKQKSPYHAITYGNCKGMMIRNNRIERYDGSSVFVMSWWNKNTTITKNEFIDVYSGLVLHVKGSEGKPIQNPVHDGVEFFDNTIKIGRPMGKIYTPTGIQLNGQNIDDRIGFRNIVIRNNKIEGHHYVNAKGKDIYPPGISFDILKANYKNLVVKDNVLEFPDYSPEKQVPQEPYSMAMVFYSLERWQQDKKSGNIVFRNNKNKAGMLLKPMVSNFTFDNEPLFWE